MSLQGTLTTLGITEVLEFLAQRDATGQLDITTDKGTATYLFSEGDVAQCEYSFVRESAADPAEATYYIVSEIDGTFFFDEDQHAIDIDNCEAVSSVLSRTAEIAEKWHEIETKIETPDHVLVRNNELDGSVTIEPEWWKTLEVIGSGKTSLEIAAATDQGLLDASLLVLDMTNAGLLNVNDAHQPGEVTEPLESDVHEVVETPEVDTTEANDVLAMEPLAAPEIPEVATIDAPEAVVDQAQPVQHAPAATAQPQVAEPAAVQPSAVISESQPVAATPVEDFAPAFDAPATEAPVEIVSTPDVAPSLDTIPVPVSDGAPSLDTIPVSAPLATPAPEIEFAVPTQAAPTIPAVPAVAPVADDDDGWASDHSLSYDAAQSAAPVAEPATQFAPMPQPHPQHSSAEVFNTLPLDSAPQSTAPAEPAAPTDVASEVLDDLATLSTDLGEVPPPAEGNWELDDTFATEEAAVAPVADADPFGALGSLLEDEESDEDRSSVLKFLRRD